ncbi:MAG: hypothetical protein Phyf2KO_15740 [Phycisphaerales bacterium]
MPVRPYFYTPDTFKKLYMWWWILIAVGIVTMIILIGIFALIAAAVIGYIFLFKCWNQIQDGYQKTTPGKAVGFLFIPFFNIYWQFVCLLGLAQNLNAYSKRHNVNAPLVSESLAMTFCILNICSIVPYLGLLAGIGAMVIAFIMFNQFKSASAAIAQHMSGPTQGQMA